MTAYDDFLALTRGKRNWGSGELTAVISYLYTLITTNPGSTLALNDVLTATEYTGSSNQTPSSVTNAFKMEFTAASKYLRFPVTGAGNNLFNGQYIVVENASATYAFDVQLNDGTVLINVPASRKVFIICTDDSTTNGRYTVIAPWLEKDTLPKLGAALDCNGYGINMSDQVLSRPEVKDYAESLTTANSGTAYTCDLTNGNNFAITLTGNCTFTFSNPPASGKAGAFTLILKQDATGGRTTTWPASVDWASGGTPPTLTTSANAVDILSFYTVDGGTTWYGFLAGANFT